MTVTIVSAMFFLYVFHFLKFLSVQCPIFSDKLVKHKGLCFHFSISLFAEAEDIDSDYRVERPIFNPSAASRDLTTDCSWRL